MNERVEVFFWGRLSEAQFGGISQVTHEPNADSARCLSGGSGVQFGISGQVQSVALEQSEASEKGRKQSRCRSSKSEGKKARPKYHLGLDYLVLVDAQIILHFLVLLLVHFVHLIETLACTGQSVRSASAECIAKGNCAENRQNSAKI